MSFTGERSWYTAVLCSPPISDAHTFPSSDVFDGPSSSGMGTWWYWSRTSWKCMAVTAATAKQAKGSVTLRGLFIRFPNTLTYRNLVSDYVTWFTARVEGKRSWFVKNFLSWKSWIKNHWCWPQFVMTHEMRSTCSRLLRHPLWWCMKKIKGSAHMAKGDHHLRQDPIPHPQSNSNDPPAQYYLR